MRRSSKSGCIPQPRVRWRLRGPCRIEPRCIRTWRGRGVTLALLWQEYQAQHPDGYQYSRFCDLYGPGVPPWIGACGQEHRAGEKLFVDYAGQTVPVQDRQTGTLRQAQIFVAVLGASNYTSAEATWTQTLPDWIGSHVRAFAFFGGVPQLVVPNNLRSGVTKACRYEPELPPTYAALAQHYDVVVIPARVRKPRDRAKVEAGVLLVERWILARLRHQPFFNLPELNTAIAGCLNQLNRRPFKKLPGCRSPSSRRWVARPCRRFRLSPTSMPSGARRG